MLKLLNKHDKSLTVELNEYTIEHGVDTFYFDTEKDNPRVNDLNRYDGFKYKDALMSHFQSHGEVLVNFTVEALYKAKDCIIFLDEPESSLSIRNQFRLAEAVNKAALNGCQLFIATHCYPLIQAYYVFSFEDNALIKGEEYLKRFYE